MRYKIFTIVFVIITLLINMGCAVKNQAFLREEAEQERIARSFLGKEFIEFMRSNPEIHSQVNDGQGGLIYSVVIHPGMPKVSVVGPYTTTNHYSKFVAAFFVDDKGIIYDVIFQTKESHQRTTRN